MTVNTNSDISPSLMILFVDWYFLNRIVSICASFHSIYIQWTQFEHAAWHLHHFLILRDLLTCIVSLKQGVTLSLSFGSFHDLQCSLHFQVGLCGRRVVHPLHSTVSGMKKHIIKHWTFTCPDEAFPPDSWSSEEHASLTLVLTMLVTTPH